MTTSTDTQGISDEQIAAAVRPLYADDKAAIMGLADDIRTARAVLALQEADALAAIKAAQEDARRLDWIARQDLNDIAFGVVVDAPHDGEYVVNAGHGPFYGKTFRAAIDAAMGRLLGEDAGKP